MGIIKTEGVTVALIHWHKKPSGLFETCCQLGWDWLVCLISSHRPPLTPALLFYHTHPPFAPQMLSFSPSDIDAEYKRDMSVTSAVSSFKLTQLHTLTACRRDQQLCTSTIFCLVV